jgi:hypothetical protein
MAFISNEACDNSDWSSIDNDGSTISNESNGSSDLNKHIVTVDMMLDIGLNLFFKEARINRVKEIKSNSERFKIKFGVEAVTACTIYEDMQKTSIACS